MYLLVPESLWTGICVVNVFALFRRFFLRSSTAYKLEDQHAE